MNLHCCLISKLYVIVYFQKGGSFEWVDESVVQFTHWAVGEPANASLGRDCVYMNIEDEDYRDRTWSTMDCNEKLPHICMVPKSKALVIDKCTEPN